VCPLAALPLLLPVAILGIVLAVRRLAALAGRLAGIWNAEA
jgi:hypothetical protein